MKIVGDVYARCAHKFRYWFRYYVVFSKSILYILGLALSFKLVDNTVFSILVVLLKDNLPKVAIIVNLQQAACQVLYFILVCVADQYSGLFKMLICSSTLLYIIQLSICFTAARNTPGRGFFYTALGLLTLSQAAVMATLSGFLKDQLMQKDRPATIEEEERFNCRFDFWWKAASLLTSIASFPLSHFITSLEKLLMVSAIAMGVSLLWFILGIKYYTLTAPPGCPLRENAFVFYTAIVRRRAPYPENPVPPRVSWLRWLDQAAVVVDEQQIPGNRLEQVRAVKFLLKMIPLWATFFTCTVVDAVGSTLFLLQAAAIKLDVPIFFFVALERSTSFIAERVSDYVIGKYVKEDNVAQRMNLVRIGVGMACCVLCCVAAWVNAEQLRKNPKASILVITPQVALLGLMTGFLYYGLQKFFASQVPKSTAKYAEPFSNLVMGYGGLVSVVFIVIFRGHPFNWLQEDIPTSRLDKYYGVLMILSLANLVFYVFVAYWYGDETFPSEDPRADAKGVRSSDQELGGSQSEDTSVDAEGLRSSDQELGGSHSEDTSVDAEGLCSSGQELEDRRIPSLH